MVAEPKKIFIVDDDQFLLNMYSLKFGKGGFDVSTSVSAADALLKLRGGFVPDIILLDIIMPGMDGLEFLQTIRKENLATNATCIVLSNQGQAVDINKAKEYGIAGYIVKASSIPSEVLKAVSEIYKKCAPTKS